MKNFARNYFANWLTVSCWDLHSKHSTWIRILSHCENCPPATPRHYFWCIWGILHVPVDKIHAQRVLSTLQQRLGQYAWNSGKGLNTQCALRVRLLRVQFMQLLPLGHNKFLSWTPINEPYHEWMWNLEMKNFFMSFMILNVLWFDGQNPHVRLDPSSFPVLTLRTLDLRTSLNMRGYATVWWSITTVSGWIGESTGLQGIGRQLKAIYWPSSSTRSTKVSCCCQNIPLGVHHIELSTRTPCESHLKSFNMFD